MVSFHSFLYVYQRVSPTKLQLVLEDRNSEVIRCHLQPDAQNTFPRQIPARFPRREMMAVFIEKHIQTPCH